MSVNFYTNISRMIGCDVHEGFPLPVFTDMYLWWPGTFHKNTDTVLTRSGYKFIQDGYDLLFPVHIPLAPEPQVGIAAAIATATGGSKPFLVKMTVSGEGKPLACCLYGFYGLNTNCWSAGPLKKGPSGIVLSGTTVVTTPSPGDWAAAAAGLIFDNVKSLAMGKLLKRLGLTKLPATILKQLLRHVGQLSSIVDKAVGFPVSPMVAPLLGGLGILLGTAKSSGIKGKMKKSVQEAVDDYFAEGD